MSLLYMQGFDFLQGLGPNVGRGYLDADGWYGGYAAGPVAEPGPLGGYAARFEVDGLAHPNLSIFVPSTSTGKVFFGVRTRYYTNIYSPGFQFGNDLKVYFDYPGVVVAECGGITARSSAGVISQNGWVYLDFMMDLDDGGFEVRVNTEVVISVGTSAISGDPIDYFRFLIVGPSGGTGTAMLDDMYMLNDEGSDNNTYLGNVRVRSHLAVANGDHIDFTAVNAATNWEAITSADFGKTSYVQGDTVGQYDLYDMSANADARNIYGICTRASVRQADATQLFTKPVLKTGGTEFEGTEKATQSSFRIQREMFDVNPDTGIEWTNSELNTLQVGVKLSASG